MATEKLIDLVNRLKESGINISLTKPRTQSLLQLLNEKNILSPN